MKRLLVIFLEVVLVLSLCLILLPATPAMAARVINVPGNYSTIQAAINAASYGDAIFVAAGTYNERITLKDGVKVLGAGSGFTTINGSGRTVTAISVGTETKLDGFTITHSEGNFGGGMYNENSSPTVSYCFFVNNSDNFGGGMYNYNSSPLVSSCAFSGNSASYGDGGGMYNEHSSPTVTDCIFGGNSASYGNGGGMYNVYSSPTLSNCVFNRNLAEDGAGMYNLIAPSLTVTNCEFINNMASLDGGGMYNDASQSTVTNCIFYGNGSSRAGCGMFNNASQSTVTNCVFWKGKTKQIINITSDTSPITYCNIEGGFTGIGNINTDPRFIWAANGNFHFQPGSPCIDKGNNLAPSLPDTDMEECPRIIDGNGDGNAIVDMGTYEYSHPLGVPFQYNLTVNITGQGTVAKNPDQATYDLNTPVQLMATPATGWQFSHWSDDEEGNSNPINVAMSSDKTVTANFALQGITLLGAINQNPVAYGGQTVRLSGVYRGWESGHGSPPVTRSDWVIKDDTSSIYVTGNALGLRYPADVGKPATVNGTVRLKNGQTYIEIPSVPPRVFTSAITGPTSGSVQLNGTLPSLGSASTVNVSFQWGVSPGNYTGETTAIALSTASAFSSNISGLASGKTYYFRAKGVGEGTVYGAEMTFTTPKQYTLTIIASGSSGATDPVAGTYTYTEGMVVRVTATPSPGWQFDHWSGDASGNFNPIVVTMNNSKNITANFIPQGTTIAAIKANPEVYNGQTVTISGEYRGSEGGYGKPPVSRNDWVIKDNTGSIYVTGNTLGLRYPVDVGKPVTVNGTVRLKNGQPYIEIARKR